jgi:hypothetical protein
MKIVVKRIVCNKKCGFCQQERVREHKRVKLHKENTEEEARAEVELEEEVSPEEDEEEEEEGEQEEEESSISSTSKPVTDIRVTMNSLKPYSSGHINCSNLQNQCIS